MPLPAGAPDEEFEPTFGQYASAWYTTRGAVMRATDITAAAYSSSEIDRAIDSASAAVDELCHRGSRKRGIPGFAPWVGTLTFDWPKMDVGNSWAVWLNQFSLISTSALTSGGVDIAPASVFLEPYASGPPYNRITLDRRAQYYFSSGTGVGQRSLAVTGTWGYTDRSMTRSGWTLGSNPDANATTLTINAPVDVGHILAIGGERVIVQERAWSSSGQTGTLASSTAAQSMAVSNGAAFYAGEEILLDAERMLIRDISNNTLIVQRAVGGSTLAAHTGAAINYSRSFTVARGALGTTATGHSAGTQIYVWQPPAPVEQLTIAYALDIRAQETSGYARTVGSGESERNASQAGLRALEERVYGAYGRRIRSRAV